MVHWPALGLGCANNDYGGFFLGGGVFLFHDYSMKEISVGCFAQLHIKYHIPAVQHNITFNVSMFITTGFKH